MVHALKGLAVLSTQLNEKSDHLNQTIAKFNEKLGALNLGIETWLVHDPVEEGEYHDNSTSFAHVRSARATLLGYCRVANDWQLAIKQATLNNHVEEGEEYTIVTDSSTPTPLLQASRSIRMTAMGSLEALLTSLQTEASIMLSGIEAAEDAAAKL
jgi:hypothetical protein